MEVYIFLKMVVLERVISPGWRILALGQFPYEEKDKDWMVNFEEQRWSLLLRTYSREDRLSDKDESYNKKLFDPPTITKGEIWWDQTKNIFDVAISLGT